MSLLIAVLLAASPARAADPALSSSLKSDVDSLVAFGERNACSTAPDAGVARAASWIAGRYGASPRLRVVLQDFEMPAKDCGGKPVPRQNVLAVLEGGDLKNEVVVLSGHFDSIAFTRCQGWHQAHPEIKWPWPQEKRAPGANDSGSQTAVLLETAARASSGRFRRTVVFASFAGEEQGLDGSAAFVKDFSRLFPGRRLVADVNYDIIGGDVSVNDSTSSWHYRLFAPTQTIHQELAEKVLAANARELPAFVADVNKTADRPRRSGDQISFQHAGIPAVRIIEARENLDHQHCAADEAKNISPEYESRVVELSGAIVSELAEKAKPK